MLKTVKGKVIAGTMAVGLLSSAGVALGATDAGANLKAWYDGQFGQASASVDTQYTGYQKDKFEGFDQKVTDLKDYATKNIDEVSGTAITKSNKKIDDQKKEHIAAISKEKANIEGYMGDQFKKLSAEAQIKINDAAETARKDAEAAIATHTVEEGNAARAHVKKEIEAATSTAVSELQKAIDNAKSELQNQLDSKSTATVKELTDLIDAKINTLSQNLENATNKLLARQYAYITNDAGNLEKAAMQEMADLVNGMK